jgi:hypothetical protein
MPTDQTHLPHFAIEAGPDVGALLAEYRYHRDEAGRCVLRQLRERVVRDGCGVWVGRHRTRQEADGTARSAWPYGQFTVLLLPEILPVVQLSILLSTLFVVLFSTLFVVLFSTLFVVLLSILLSTLFVVLASTLLVVSLSLVMVTSSSDAHLLLHKRVLSANAAAVPTAALTRKTATSKSTIRLTIVPPFRRSVRL